jgi:hypothetical protein
MAKKAGVYKGRKPSLTAEQVKEIRRRVMARKQKTGLATEHAVSRDATLKANSITAESLFGRLHHGTVVPFWDSPESPNPLGDAKRCGFESYRTRFDHEHNWLTGIR